MRDLHGPFVLDVGIPTSKSLDDGDILIEGYAADFTQDRQGEKFLSGAFDEACKAAAQGNIPILLQHNANQPLGVVEDLKTDDNGLYIKGRIMAKAVEDAWEGAPGKLELIRRGVMKGLSVRGHSWGRMGQSGPEIGHIDLAEISVTPTPVQPGALFAVTKKSMDYAVEGPTAAPDLAWAAQGFAEAVTSSSPEDVEAAVESYYKERIGRMRKQLKAAKTALDALKS